MKNYEFKLTPAYCLFNGVAVMEQKGSFIKFILENEGDVLLKERLKKAFENHVETVLKDEKAPLEYKNTIKVIFEKGNRVELRKYVSELYESKNGDGNIKAFNIENKEKEDEAAAVLLLESIISEAKRKKATDIHIERNSVRFRIHGKLESRIVLQREKANEVVQRIKLLAGMNVIEKKKSQDGHFVFGEENPVFVRASTMSIISDDQMESEESVVLRLLDTTRIPLSLSQLGFSIVQYEGIKNLCTEKNGLIVICGPTGAGKSTTAASILLYLNRRENGRLKIVSLEDPPEYIIPGITQIQIDDTKNNTYDDALIHVFRQDPDVIMIGEIRDEKSALAAIRASLTGHLVVATLHTMSAAGALMRMENLGIGRKILGSLLRGVIVQDLTYTGGIPEVLADVALPVYSFAADLRSDMGEGEIEKLFDHLTNYSEVINRNLGNKGKRKVLPFITGAKIKNKAKEA